MNTFAEEVKDDSETISIDGFRGEKWGTLKDTILENVTSEFKKDEHVMIDDDDESLYEILGEEKPRWHELLLLNSISENLMVGGYRTSAHYYFENDELVAGEYYTQAVYDEDHEDLIKKYYEVYGDSITGINTYGIPYYL